MPKLSCIIPVVGSTEGLEATLVSVLERRPADCEILVVHNIPYEDPYDLGDEVRFVEASPRLGYVGCANLGIRSSRADIVHLLSARFEATDGWIDAALARLADPSVAVVTPVVYDAAQRGRILAAGMSLTRGGRPIILENVAASASARKANVFPIAQAAFFRRSALQDFGGGLSMDLGDDLAAIDLALGLQYAGYQTVLEPGCTIRAASESLARAKENGGFRYGRAAERLFWRNLPASGWFAAIGLHAPAVAAELLRSLPSGAAFGQCLGRLAGLASVGAIRAHRREREAARANKANGESRGGATTQLWIDRRHPQLHPRTPAAPRPSEPRLRRA